MGQGKHACTVAEDGFQSIVAGAEHQKSVVGAGRQEPSFKILRQIAQLGHERRLSRIDALDAPRQHAGIVLLDHQEAAEAHIFAADLAARFGKKVFQNLEFAAASDTHRG